jgi:hypothetical protein
MSVEQLPPRLRLTDFIIDCPDTMALAAFYSEVTATAGGSTPVRLATRMSAHRGGVAGAMTVETMLMRVRSSTTPLGLLWSTSLDTTTTRWRRGTTSMS